MNLASTTQNEQIRKIEDIIDIQKANGNFTVRQVAFNLPEKENVSASVARSLESGLTNARARRLEKKIKKSRLKRRKSPTADVISWPSDSDITVLRMKLCLTSSDLKERAGNEIPGDGLHQPDDSSMVNLAMLMRQSQPPSKHSIIEEYLLPLTSWEQGPDHEVDNKPIVEEKLTKTPVAQLRTKLERHTKCSKLNNSHSMYYNCCDLSSEASTKSKIARFLRLYFCPCCRCLYKMENMNEDPSTYWEKRGEQKY